MENNIDKWIESMPDGRNERCPCGCGLKWKKVELDPKPHFEAFSKSLPNDIEIFPIDIATKYKGEG